MKRLTVILIGLALLAVLASWSTNVPTAEAVPFNQRHWIEASSLHEANDPGCYRGGMAMKLVKSRLLNGKTGPELFSLLGEPNHSSAGSWTYPVGQCGMFWEHFNLRLDIGPDGRVRHAAVVKEEG